MASVEHVNSPRGAVQALFYVWDVGTLTWTEGTQPSAGGGGGPATIANGADVTEGSVSDVAVVSDVNGTISAKLRGLVKIFADVWDSTNHKLKTDAGLSFVGGAATVKDSVLEGATHLDGEVFGGPGTIRTGALVIVRKNAQIATAPVEDTFQTAISDAEGRLYVNPNNGYKIQFDYAGGSNPIYLGTSPPGTTTASAAWQIRKLTYDVSNNLTAIAYAGGSRVFNQVWDNRAALIYS